MAESGGHVSPTLADEIELELADIDERHHPPVVRAREGDVCSPSNAAASRLSISSRFDVAPSLPEFAPSASTTIMTASKARIADTLLLLELLTSPAILVEDDEFSGNAVGAHGDDI